MKRGQITYFIIAGLIILIAVIMVLTTRMDLLKNFYEEQRIKLVDVPAEIEPVKNYIQECLNDVSKTGTDFVLLQGGYYEPTNYIGLDLFRVAYWFDGKDISPTLTIVQKEISKSISPLLTNCIKDFDASYDINITSLNINTKINEKSIIHTLNIKASIIYKNITYNLNKNFNLKQDSDIFDIIGTAKQIVKSEELNPDEIDISYLAEIPYDINFFKENENEIVYIIVSNETTLYFANRFK